METDLDGSCFLPWSGSRVWNSCIIKYKHYQIMKIEILIKQDVYKCKKNQLWNKTTAFLFNFQKVREKDNCKFISICKLNWYQMMVVEMISSESKSVYCS